LNCPAINVSQTSNAHKFIVTGTGIDPMWLLW